MSSVRRLGFTLVELLIVVGVIAILAAVVVPSINRARASARVVVCTSNLQQLHTAWKTFASVERPGRKLMSLPDASEWVTIAKVTAPDTRIFYCPDGTQASTTVATFDKEMITTSKPYSGNGHPAPVWSPDPATNPTANSYTVTIKYQNARPNTAIFVITRLSGNSWKAFAQRVDSGGAWGGPPINMSSGTQTFLNIQQGQTINFLFGDSGTNYGFNVEMGGTIAPRQGKVLAMDYDKSSIDYNGDVSDDNVNTYLKAGRHSRQRMMNVLKTDGSVQLMTLKELDPTASKVYRNQ